MAGCSRACEPPPGRDPRPGFQAAQFADGVEDIKDLREGMILEGVVSNVAAFGAVAELSSTAGSAPARAARRRRRLSTAATWAPNTPG